MRRALLLLLLALPVGAHHSTAIYDQIHGTIITGDVTEFVWENPHVHIYLDVHGEDSEPEHWTVEMESPYLLKKLGWQKDTLKARDEITVTGGRAKDNSFRIRANYVELPDGRKLPGLPVVEN